tara:strand:+ start:111 stop:854 length:744 start_codon:yes stop_codon:yes gene_type:complete
MGDLNLTKNLKNLLDNYEYRSNSDSKYKLIAIFGLLGDFDSIEYATNLGKLIKTKKYEEDLDIYALGIGNDKGKEKFCDFTQLKKKYIQIVSNNKIHNDLGISSGLNVGLGGWINMLIMLSGINSNGTIKEVLRGYTGDRNAAQIYYEQDKINLFNIFKFSGNLFKKTCGEGYLRPFELATFRLNNMIEIINNWDDYILNIDYLPQRGASFLLDKHNNIIYKYYSNDVLSYSEDMNSPLNFISKFIK